MWGRVAAVLVATVAVMRCVATEQFSMVLANPMEEDVDLFWLSPDKGVEPYLMGKVASGHSMNVNTFDGHKFAWRKLTSPTEAMYDFTVKEKYAGTTMDMPGMTQDVGNPVRKANIGKVPPKRKQNRIPKGEGKVDTKGLGGLSFRNMVNRPLVLYWKNVGTGEYKFQATLGTGEQSGFQTYPGHVFIWAEVGVDPPVPIGEFTITAGQNIYKYTDETTTREAMDELQEEVDFREEYFEVNGFDWIGTAYPRPPPTLYMHRPTKIGEFMSLEMNDKARQFKCSKEEMDDCLDKKNRKNSHKKNTYQEGPDTLEVETISTQPRVFRIKNFLSDYEADYIITQAKPQLTRSTTGHGKNARVDDVRTSKSAWLSRKHGNVMDAIYRRIAVATNIPQKLIMESKIAENLNVLNYPVGGEYTPHYDIGADGVIHSRFISGLLYLNTPEEGGGTSFPKAVMDDGSEGAYVEAVKGTFTFFYDLLEDGNVDVRSLHSGTKVTKGEKWVSPLWLWEPSRSGRPHGMGDLSRRAQDGDEPATVVTRSKDDL